MTRRSTPKYEVVSGSFVILSGKSKTDCEKIAAQMNKGQPSNRKVRVRAVDQ